MVVLVGLVDDHKQRKNLKLLIFIVCINTRQNNK